MGTLSLIELEGLMTKSHLKKVLRRHLFTKRHDLESKVTDKVVVKCLIYISGYIKCMAYHGIQPINTQEVKELLIEECIDWITLYVDGGGK